MKGHILALILSNRYYYPTESNNNNNKVALANFYAHVRQENC